MDRIIKLKISVSIEKTWTRFSTFRKVFLKKKQESTKSNI